MRYDKAIYFQTAEPTGSVQSEGLVITQMTT